jgi:hypothetical protein
VAVRQDLKSTARVSETLAGGGPLTCWLSLHSTSLRSAAASEKSEQPLATAALRDVPFQETSKTGRSKTGARATSFRSCLRSQSTIGQDLRQDQNWWHSRLNNLIGQAHGKKQPPLTSTPFRCGYFSPCAWTGIRPARTGGRPPGLRSVQCLS